MPNRRDPDFQRAVRLIESMLVPAAVRGVPATAIMNAGQAIGLSPWKLRQAREYLHVIVEKQTEVKHGQWIWSLPPNHDAVPLPPPETNVESPPPPGTATTEEQARLWALKQGYEVSRYGPLPQRIIDHFKSGARNAGPVGAHNSTGPTNIFYQARCQNCDAPTQVLTREVETRERAVTVEDANGVPTRVMARYQVGDFEQRYIMCDRCKGKQTSKRAEKIRRQIKDLEYEKLRLAGGYAYDPGILSAQRSIDALTAELAQIEGKATNA